MRVPPVYRRAAIDLANAWDATCFDRLPADVTHLRITRLGGGTGIGAWESGALEWFDALEAYLGRASLLSLAISGALAGWGRRIQAALAAAPTAQLRHLRLRGLSSREDTQACLDAACLLPSLHSLVMPSAYVDGFLLASEKLPRHVQALRF